MLSEIADHPPRLVDFRRGSGKVLIAIHGGGRGRPSAFIPLLLQYLSQHRPELIETVRIWSTGTPQPSLNDVQAVIFMLADPISHHPACETEARLLARSARECGIRLLNPPESLNNTVKSRQAEIWKKAGLPCAGGVAANNESELRALLEGAQYPVLLRSNDHHVQVGATVCNYAADALNFLESAEYPIAMLEFVDTRESWARQQRGCIFGEYFHKRRSMVFGSHVMNNHIFFSSEPIVGARTSTFFSAQCGVQTPRLQEMVSADLAYSSARAEAPKLMIAATKALGIDIAAIDYSTKADGSIILWEANPYFHLPPWSKALLNGPRRLQERVPRMLSAIGEAFDMLTGANPP